MSSKVLQIEQEKKELEIPANLDELVAQERQQRQAECLKELDALMVKYRCQLVPVFQLGDQQIPVGQIVTPPVRVLITSQ